MHKLTMPVRSRVVKDEPNHLGILLSLLEVARGQTSSANQGKALSDSRIELPPVTHSVVSMSEGACQWEKYSLLV